jgi:ketosteroid isomerase-like protein
MPQRSTDVEAAVRDWLDAKQAGDSAAIRAGLSAYDDALAIGTGAAEWWVGAASFADAHAATAPFSAAIEQVDAHQEGAVGWAAVRALVRWDNAETPVRLTLVLIREDRGWQIVQSHVSTPAA